jgi:hypothetical protein
MRWAAPRIARRADRAAWGERRRRT